MRTGLLLLATLVACNGSEDDSVGETDEPVEEENQPPTAGDDVAEVQAGFEVEIAVLLNDSDPDVDQLSVESVTTPANGASAITTGDRFVTYTPTAGFVGEDTFDYTVTDGNGGSATATVTVTVSEPPDYALVIVSPADGVKISDFELEIVFEVTDCNIATPSADPNGCHVHKWLDGEKWSDAEGSNHGHYEETPFTLTDLELGEHSFELFLVPNDGSDLEFDPPFSDTITFTVRERGVALDESATESWAGEQPDSELGTAVWVADLDDEGSLQLVLGAPGDDYVLVSYTDASDTVVEGPEGSRLGHALASFDEAGDGDAELAIGAPRADGDGDERGAVWVLDWPLTGDADATIEGVTDYGYLGTSVASVGDATGDGVDDLLIGAPGVGQGRVYLISGEDLNGAVSVDDAMATLSGVGSDDIFGEFAGAAVAGGDVDGDGLGDMVVGGPYRGSTGAAYVMLGGAEGSLDLEDADLTFLGDEDGADLGASIGHSLAVADLDDDGYAELVVGAPGVGGGAVYVVAQGTESLVGETDGDMAGATVAVGPLDGVMSLLVGAPCQGGGVGAAYVLDAASTGAMSLADEGVDKLFEDTAAGVGGLCSTSSWSRPLALPGDLDGDSVDDILVAAPVGGGAVWLLASGWEE